MTKVGKAALALIAVAVVAVAVVSGGSAAPQAKRHDRLGIRRRREHGAVRRARARDREVAHRGREQDELHQVRLLTCNTQGNKPAIAKACAGKLLGQGADIDHDHV